MRPWLVIVLVIAAGFGAFQYVRPVLWPPPVPLENEDYQITKVQPYILEALVLATKDYRRKEGGEVMPVDLALAWGTMADPDKADRLEIDQRNRFYYWKADGPTLQALGRSNIEGNTANVHCVPADDLVRTSLFQVRPGERILLKGHLVDIRGPDRSWSTSRSRTDTGPGACEIFLIETLTRSRG